MLIIKVYILGATVDDRRQMVDDRWQTSNNQPACMMNEIVERQTGSPLRKR